MAKLEYTTIKALEELFCMSSGYVIDFSNNSFESFIKGVIGIDIYRDKGYEEYCSKANKLRQVLKRESNSVVTKLINELLNYYEDFKLKNNQLTEYDKNKIAKIKKSIENIGKEDSEKVIATEEVNKLIKKISTRNAEFSDMAIDEKLKEIGNLIEYLLKEDGKFITLNYEHISLGLVKENDIKELRKKVHCFRHSSKESIKERKGYSDSQKNFIVEFGIVVCNLIYNELKNN